MPERRREDILFAVRIGIDVEGVRQWRAYSLTHGPRRDGRISITVKAVPDGLVSNRPLQKLQKTTYSERAHKISLLVDNAKMFRLNRIQKISEIQLL